MVNATKERIGKAQLGALFEGGGKLLVAKGKKVTEVDLRKEAPGPEELAELVLGPTGNLRAPAVRAGKTWLVGFHEDAWAEVLG